ncbi:MAG: RNA-binding protein [Rhodothermaceae bacterium]|nr:RNA-binding protein [Rhodothermaceae bacterium]
MPTGQRVPRDTVGYAVHVMKLVTGQIGEPRKPEPPTARAAAGKAGGESRAKRLSPEERSEIARKAAKARWQVCIPPFWLTLC